MESTPIAQDGLSDLQLFGLVLGNVFLTPLLGLCLYLIWKGDSPGKAAQVGRVTLAIGIVLGAVTFFALLNR